MDVTRDQIIDANFENPESCKAAFNRCVEMAKSDDILVRLQGIIGAASLTAIMLYAREAEKEADARYPLPDMTMTMLHAYAGALDGVLQAVPEQYHPMMEKVFQDAREVHKKAREAVQSGSPSAATH